MIYTNGERYQRRESLMLFLIAHIWSIPILSGDREDARKMLKIGLWDTRTIYYYVIYIHWLVSGVMSGGAYNEHIFSIY